MQPHIFSGALKENWFMVLLICVSTLQGRASLNYGANILPEVIVTTSSICVTITEIERMCEKKSSN